jgi:hypothetical protein
LPRKLRETPPRRRKPLVILIIPIEEAAAEGLRILDAAEPLRKLGLIF